MYWAAFMLALVICNVKSKKIKAAAAVIAVALAVFAAADNVYSWFLFDSYQKSIEYESPYGGKTIVLQGYYFRGSCGIRVYKKISDFIYVENDSHYLSVTDDLADMSEPIASMDKSTLTWIDENHYSVAFWKEDNESETGYSMYDYIYEI